MLAIPQFFTVLIVAQTLHTIYCSPPPQQRTQSREIGAVPAEQPPPKKAMQMVRRPDLGAPLRTPYFDQATYTSRDLPRLIEGLGQHINHDLGQARAELVEHAELVKQLRVRVDRLEQKILSPAENGISMEFLAILALILLATLALLLVGTLLLAKYLLKMKHHSSNSASTHIRLTEEQQESV